MKNIYLSKNFNEVKKEKAYYIIVRSPAFCGLEEGYYKKSRKNKGYTNFLTIDEIEKLIAIDKIINNGFIDMTKYMSMVDAIFEVKNFKNFNILTRTQISHILQILGHYQENGAVNMRDIMTVLNLFEDKEKTDKQRDFFKEYIKENKI